VCRFALPTGPSGEYALPQEALIDAEPTEEDAGPSRPLPWDPPNLPLPLPLLWLSGLTLAAAVLVAPALLGWWAVQQRSWRLGLLPLLWLGLVLGLAVLHGLLDEASPGRSLGWPAFVRAQAGRLVESSLAGVPALAFAGLSGWWLLAGRWRRLTLLLAGSVLLTPLLALAWLWRAGTAPEPEVYRTGTTWLGAWFLGAYAAGALALVLLVGRVLVKRTLRGVRRLAVGARPA
jgi:hypothetical protein